VSWGGEELICVKSSGIFTLHGVYGWEIRKRIEAVDGQGFCGGEDDGRLSAEIRLFGGYLTWIAWYRGLFKA
jgi:hypothetical protein